MAKSCRPGPRRPSAVRARVCCWPMLPARSERPESLVPVAMYASRLLPKPQRNWHRVNVELIPPRSLIADAVQLAMVNAAERNRELVGHSAPERSRLREPQVVWIRRLAAAYQAWAFGYPFDMHFVSEPAGFWEGEHAFVDWLAAGAAVSCVSISRRRLLGSWRQGGRCPAAPSSFSKPAILARNASSTRRASAAARLFFAFKLLLAQTTAASGESSASTCAKKKLAERTG